jgi:hypothetical protein
MYVINIQTYAVHEEMIGSDDAVHTNITKLDIRYILQSHSEARMDIWYPAMGFRC